MTTLTDVCAVVRRYLSDPTGVRNKVDTHITGQVSFQYPLKNIVAGSTFSCGLQTFYVWDVNTGSETAYVDVVQGAATLLPTNATVRVSPKYTDWDIMQAVNDSLVALSSPSAGLFQMKSVELPYNATLVGYDLTGATDIDSLYAVLQASPGPFKDWTRKRPSKVWIDRSADPTDFPSGMSINIYDPGFQGFAMRILYKAPFGSFAALADTAASIGVTVTLTDLVALGAAINLMSGKEIARNATDVAGDTRRAGEVPAGAVANSYNGLRAQYQTRLAQEAARLQRQWPSRRGG